MRELGKLNPTLRLLAETLNSTLQLEAALKEAAETLRRLERAERVIREPSRNHSQQTQNVEVAHSCHVPSLRLN